MDIVTLLWQKRTHFESMEARFDSGRDGIWYVDGLMVQAIILTLRTRRDIYLEILTAIVRERDRNGQLSGFQPVFGILRHNATTHIWGHRSSQVVSQF